MNNIKLWHYFGDARKYHDVIVQVSNDSSFSTGVTTVYNNDTNNSAGRGTGKDTEYSETSSGLSIEFNTISARYVRFYSNGSTSNNYNHYVEVQISYEADQTPTPVVSYNLAYGKLPTASTTFSNPLNMTNGQTDTYGYSDSYPTAGLQWVRTRPGLRIRCQQHQALALLRRHKKVPRRGSPAFQ